MQFPSPLLVDEMRSKQPLLEAGDSIEAATLPPPLRLVAENLSFLLSLEISFDDFSFDVFLLDRDCDETSSSYLVVSSVSRSLSSDPELVMFDDMPLNSLSMPDSRRVELTSVYLGVEPNLVKSRLSLPERRLTASGPDDLREERLIVSVPIDLVDKRLPLSASDDLKETRMSVPTPEDLSAWRLLSSIVC